MRIEEVVEEALLQDCLQPVTHRGGNSSVTRVTVGDWALAVKSYASRADGRHRCAQESHALLLLHRVLPGLAPQLLGVSADGLRGVLTWINGKHPPWNRKTCQDMVAMLQLLHEAAADKSFAEAPLATDSLLGNVDIETQCHQRLAVLAPTERAWVTEIAEPVLASLNAARGTESAVVETLSPSDFGPHNLLVDDSGRMHCIDLEFFGWDDAHKLVIDTLCHPRNTWGLRERELFLESTTALYGLRTDRLVQLVPWLVLKWGLIIRARSQREAHMDKESEAQDSRERSDLYLARAVGAARDGVASLLAVEADDLRDSGSE